MILHALLTPLATALLAGAVVVSPLDHGAGLASTKSRTAASKRFRLASPP